MGTSIISNNSYHPLQFFWSWPGNTPSKSAGGHGWASKYTSKGLRSVSLTVCWDFSLSLQLCSIHIDVHSYLFSHPDFILAFALTFFALLNIVTVYTCVCLSLDLKLGIAIIIMFPIRIVLLIPPYRNPMRLLDWWQGERIKSASKNVFRARSETNGQWSRRIILEFVWGHAP